MAAMGSFLRWTTINFFFLWSMVMFHVRSAFRLQPNRPAPSKPSATATSTRASSPINRCPFLRALVARSSVATTVLAASVPIATSSVEANDMELPPLPIGNPRAWTTAFPTSSGFGADFLPTPWPNCGDFNEYCHPAGKDPGSIPLCSTAMKPATISAPKLRTDLLASVKSKRKSSSDALQVVVIGLSHHNSKVDVREKLAVPEAEWNLVSSQLSMLDSVHEAAVLSTCNRFEIYLAGTNPYEVIRDATQFLLSRAEQRGGDFDYATLRSQLFMLQGDDAMWHLLRVAAGLDSLVVGEGQILAQVKKAHEHSTQPFTFASSNDDEQTDDVSSSSSSSSSSSAEGGITPAGKVISRLLNTAVAAGKRVRAETAISKGAVSISSAALEFALWKLPETAGISANTVDTQADIVIVGAGKMARLLLHHLQSLGVRRVTVVNRSMARVDELQAEFPDVRIQGVLMDQLYEVMRSADIVFPSTASEEPIVEAAPLAECMRLRVEGSPKAPAKHTGLQLVDISVPRNVQPACANVPGVHSYNVDDLKAVVARNTAKRKKEMIEAEGILQQELDKFASWHHSLSAIPTITKLQEKAEMYRVEEVNKIGKRLSATWSPKDLEVVERATKGIVAKLLHGPMHHLRQCHSESSMSEGGSGGTRAAIQQVTQAFKLAA